MAIMALILINLSACSQSRQHTVYNTSVDVPLDGWASTDTLFYHLTVSDSATIKYPIGLHQDYQLRVSIRYASHFPLLSVPMLLTLQQTDTTGGYERPVRNLMRQQLQPMVRDTLGLPLGNTWGSLISMEEATDLTVRFDTSGCYRILLTPQFGYQRSLPGIASIGLQLCR